MNSTCSRACEERDITLIDPAPHLDIEGSCEIHTSDPERFLGRYPVSGEGGVRLLTAGVFRHLARETFVQHPFDGLATAQYPELFPELGGDPDSPVMEAYVRVP